MRHKLFNHPAQASEPLPPRQQPLALKKSVLPVPAKGSEPRTASASIQRRYDEMLARLAYQSPSPERDEQMAKLERHRQAALEQVKDSPP